MFQYIKIYEKYFWKAKRQQCWAFLCSLNNLSMPAWVLSTVQRHAVSGVRSFSPWSGWIYLPIRIFSLRCCPDVCSNANNTNRNFWAKENKLTFAVQRALAEHPFLVSLENPMSWLFLSTMLTKYKSNVKSMKQ